MTLPALVSVAPASVDLVSVVSWGGSSFIACPSLDGAVSRGFSSLGDAFLAECSLLEGAFSATAALGPLETKRVKTKVKVILSIGFHYLSRLVTQVTFCSKSCS